MFSVLWVVPRAFPLNLAKDVNYYDARALLISTIAKEALCALELEPFLELGPLLPPRRHQEPSTTMIKHESVGSNAASING